MLQLMLPSLNRLRNTYRQRAKARHRGTAESAWGAALDQVIENLEYLNRSTEQDFLTVGEKLMEFRTVARKTAAEMTALTELISGEQGSKTGRALSGMLGYSRDLDSRVGESKEALASVHGFARRIPLAFSGLRARVLVFRTLCTLTRIETSRLGKAGSGFDDLAEEVKPLSESIQSSGEQVLAGSIHLDERLRGVLRNVSDMQARQLGELHSMIDRVMESLREFEERRQRAHDASVRQAVQYRAICQAIDNLVGAIQFHDITRQQIEHVVESLRQLRPGSISGNSALLSTRATAIVQLQSSQLSHAETVFAASIERLDHDLEAIGSSVGDLAAACQSLMGITGDEEKSFFLQMENYCLAIIESVRRCGAESTEIRAMAAELAEIIVHMRQSVDKIRALEIQIQRIAINANIRAAHIGEAGNALNIIAEAMQRVLLDSTVNTEDAAQALDSMSGAANCIAANSPGESATASELNSHAVLEEMLGAVAELRSSSDFSLVHLNHIAVWTSDLSEAIQSVRKEFSAGRLFADVVGHARSELERIRLLGESAPPGADRENGEADSAQGLEDLVGRYTMQAERDVHESVATGMVASPAAAPHGLPGTLEEGDLGENVELF